MTRHIAFDLEKLFKHQFFSNLDYYFARYATQIFKEKDPVIRASCAMVSRALSQGHICLDISKTAGTTAQAADEGGDLLVELPQEDVWINSLKASKMVSAETVTPLVLDSDNRLFLAKYYDFQIRLAQNIAGRHLLSPESKSSRKLEKLVEDVFESDDPTVLPQKNAVLHAVTRHFTVISGGPGTGKTYVSRLIRQVFSDRYVNHQPPDPTILCVAPTGKAASKMEQGRTIHSVLKPYRDKPGFRHNKENPLSVDMIIIDEASMIDIMLLTRLLEAVPADAHVVLLGDRHQLASVQAGSVFADICSAGVLSSDTFVLEHNFRSAGKSGIENLARAINGNDISRVEDILTGSMFDDVRFEKWVEDDDMYGIIQQLILSGYKAFLNADTVEAALEKMDGFRILCAHNSGRYGTLQINHLCENILRNPTNSGIQGDYFKRIIMVKTNDYKKELFNGDTGVTVPVEGEATAYILNQDGNIKRYRDADLPGHDTAFAITVHKSQGSEFDSVLILLPEKLSPVLTRQLLYTGVTRAKEKVAIAGKLEIIKEAINLVLEHDSGFTSCLEMYINDLSQQHKKKDS